MKIDLHCHSYYSHDGASSPKKLLEEAKKKGLDGIALTDHDTIDGWKEAKETAQKLGIFLISGEEIKTKKGDIIGIFLEKEVKGKGKEPVWVINEIKKQNGIVIVPHPFHFPENFNDDLKKYVNLVDCFEVFNSRGIFYFQDKKAFEFSQKYNLAMTAGSDSHFYKTIGDAYTIVDNANNLEDFKKAILERKTKINGKKTPLYYFIFPALTKIGLIGRLPS